MRYSRLCVTALALALGFPGTMDVQAQSHHRRGMVATAWPAPAVTEGRAVPAASHRPVAYLFRGLGDVNSLGMDALASELRARGIEASVYSHTQWEALAGGIIAQQRAGTAGPIVLIGHSLGGGAALLLAEQLGQAGIVVDLVVPVDPVWAPPVPANVRRVTNYYQANNGYGEPVGPGAGFRGMLVNADLESNRRDLWDANLSHITIDKSARVHAEIIRAVLALGRSPR